MELRKENEAGILVIRSGAESTLGITSLPVSKDFADRLYKE